MRGTAMMTITRTPAGQRRFLDLVPGLVSQRRENLVAGGGHPRRAQVAPNPVTRQSAFQFEEVGPKSFSWRMSLIAQRNSQHTDTAGPFISRSKKFACHGVL